MKLKPNTYYKRSYDTNKDDYDILYTGTKWVYDIASKYNNNLLVKYTKKFKWWTIEEWQRYIKHQHIKVEELSKEDLFLELL